MNEICMLQWTLDLGCFATCVFRFSYGTDKKMNCMYNNDAKENSESHESLKYCSANSLNSFLLARFFPSEIVRISLSFYEWEKKSPWQKVRRKKNLKRRREKKTIETNNCLTKRKDERGTWRKQTCKSKEKTSKRWAYLEKKSVWSTYVLAPRRFVGTHRPILVWTEAMWRLILHNSVENVYCTQLNRFVFEIYIHAYLYSFKEDAGFASISSYGYFPKTLLSVEHIQ